MKNSDKEDAGGKTNEQATALAITDENSDDKPTLAQRIVSVYKAYKEILTVLPGTLALIGILLSFLSRLIVLWVIWLIAIGGLGSVLAIAYIRYREQQARYYHIIAPVVLAILVTALAVLLPVTPQPAPFSNSTESSAAHRTPVVNILSPLNNTAVGQIAKVHGTWQDIPSSQKVWLVIYANEEQFYYRQMDSNISLEPGGRWSGSASLGKNQGTPDNGTYEILAVLANESASRFFAENPPHNSFAVLPTGASVLAEVAVKRTID